MLTRKKRIGIDSSPKTSVSKNIQLLSKESMQDTVNMLSTPTRRNRFMLDKNQRNMTDDSPVLSQETENISWKWNNEGTPRAVNKISKLRRSINSSPQLQHLQRLSAKRHGSDNQNGMSAATTSKLMAEPETHSPKGLYKFQEEMRKIKFDTESDTSCDNFNDKSMTADTGYPTNADGGTAPAQFHNRNNNDSLDFEMDINEPIQSSTQNDDHGIDDNLANDLMDDSDFDQVLLTCQIPAEKKEAYIISNQSTTVTNHTNVKKASSAPEMKTISSSNNSSSNSGSNWMLFDDDCFDDLVKDVDVDIPSDTLNTSGKFTRHKSMPQHPQTPTTSNAKAFNAQQSNAHLNQNINRKSLTRHESMPITNRSTMTNNYVKQPNSTFSSSQTRKCTSEEIAEKRRIAIERLKNRKNSKTNT